jgi:hypothetical protein
MNSEYRIGNEMEGSGRGLICGVIMALPRVMKGILEAFVTTNWLLA